MSIRLKDSISGPLSGNASTATTLKTARTINGTSFNGSANITTSNWGTTRTLTIGNTGKSVNGSANVSWSLAEIGAAAASHNHSYYVSGTGEHAVTGADDANYIWKSGFYDLNVDGGAKNAPFSGWNWLIHAGHSSNRSDYRYGMQIASQNGSNNFAIRTVNVNGEGTWNTLYHTGNKPTPAEIGAAATSHNHNTLVTRNLIGTGFDKTKTSFQRPNGNGLTNGQLVMHIAHPEFSNGEYSRGIAFKYGDDLGLSTYALSPDGNKITYANIYTEANKPNCVVTSNGGGVYEGNGDAANSVQANLQIKSWYGIGFGPSISGQPVPQNQNAFWMNVRNGSFSARGTIWAGGNIQSDTYMSSPTLVTNRIQGRTAANNFYLGSSNCRIDTTEGFLRLFTSYEGSADYGIRISPSGGFSVMVNNVGKHALNADGSKYGGSMEIEGITYGMSPTDSPQTLIEYIIPNVVVENEKKLELDPIYIKMISYYVAFLSNKNINIKEKGENYILLEGNGTTDILIKGQRKEASEYFKIMGGFEHGTEDKFNS